MSLHQLSRPLRIAALGACFVASCGGEEEVVVEPQATCTGLAVDVLERAIAPPANVAALVRVTDCEGQPLGRRLPEDAFALAEDGAVLSRFETARMITPAERQMAQKTLIALDLSGSIVRSGVRPTMIEGATRLTEELTPEHRIAVFGFDGRPDLIPFSYFTDEEAELLEALGTAGEASVVDDSTNLHGAVVNALRVLDRTVEADTRDAYAVTHGALVLFTDGRDLAGRVDRSAAERALEETRHSTFAIAVGTDLDSDSLAQIGKTAYVDATDTSGVVGAFGEIARELKARSEANYIVSYCSPARAGSRSLEITVRHDKLEGRARIAFDATGFGAGCSPEHSPLR